MDINEIIDNLCYFDDRRPDFDTEYDKPKDIEAQKDCSCDNCFYSRSELANEILKLIKEFSK